MLPPRIRCDDGGVRIVVMGPSGSGKSRVGAALAATRGVRFVDADDLHPAANVAKMSVGTPLTEADRMPWLDAVAGALRSADDVVVACSALTRRYRDRIRAGADDAVFVELLVPPVELQRRMTGRSHFMPPSLLASQLELLEHLGDDEEGVQVVNDGSPEAVVDGIRSLLEARPTPTPTPTSRAGRSDQSLR